MKIDGYKFMKWLHKIRAEDAKVSKGKGTEDRRDQESLMVKGLIEKYRIPVVRI